MQTINGITYTNDLKKCSHGNERLQVAEILDSVKIIRKYAFSNSGLEEVHFPEKLERIEKEAFYNTCLKEVNIEKDIIMEEAVFGNNPALNKIKVNSAFIGPKAFYYCNAPKDVTLINTQIIAESAFKFNAFNSLILPDTLSSISAYAFSATKFNFPILKLPENLKLIENGAFWNTEGLTDIYLPDSLNVIGKNVFPENVSIHVSKKLLNRIPSLNDYKIKTATLDDLIEENKSFKEINDFFKEQTVEK